MSEWQPGSGILRYSCVFSVQMFPLSLPNDLDIKSCRFPVVNLPRGTPGTCTAWLRLRPTLTSQNWHKISSQTFKQPGRVAQFLHGNSCGRERSWQEGLDIWMGQIVFLLLHPVFVLRPLNSDSDICKYFWISLLTVWRMRRMWSHFVLSETMQISPMSLKFPWPWDYHSHSSVVNPHLTAHRAGLLLSLSEIYAGYIGDTEPPGLTL